MCRRADLRVDRAGVNHLLTGLALMVLVFSWACASRRGDRVVLYQLGQTSLMEGE